MKLSYVNIVNFRSIESLRIDLNPTCRVLVGINESGKTNILDALSMLSDEHSPSREDIREPLPDEPTIKSAYIRFVFEFVNNEIEEIYNALSSKVLSHKINTPILKRKKDEIDLRNFLKMRNEGIYFVNLLDQSKSARYWVFYSTYKVLENWKKPSDACPTN
jgi:predicted ATP-dependent endonuclease of OLD family